MKPQNLLLILSDQHSPKAMGCNGNAVVRTPNLDRLAASGTRFSSAYCNSPICVPARAAIATGRYVHQTGYWDNSKGYEGSVPSWGHRLSHYGHCAESIGKLHFRSENDPTGFDRQHIPMHIVPGGGALVGVLRDGTGVLKKYRRYHDAAGPGESTYTEYDRKIAARAVDWILDRSAIPPERPWVLMVSFVCPHPPLQCPPEFYEIYPPNEMPLPYALGPGDEPSHPAMIDHRKFQDCDRPFSEDVVRRSVAAYFGLCSFMDHNVGIVLDALEESGLGESTRVIYTSDHGEANGNQGLWGKYNMYEDSVGVPLIISGEGVPSGRIVGTPASHVDLHPTILECVGAPSLEEDSSYPGTSLFKLQKAEDCERVVFSEHHAAASNTGIYMIRKGAYKYVHYVGYPDQLFDLESDPDERADLACNSEYGLIRGEMEAILRSIVNPEAVDALAKSDQDARIAAYGGRRSVREIGPFGYTPAPGEKAVYK